MTGISVNRITDHIIGAAIDVHRELGPGLLESVYQQCLALALRERGLQCDMEVCVPVMFRGRVISEMGFRVDLLVENDVVVELKSVEELKPVHLKQVLTYLRLLDKRVGLLINFNEALLRDGIVRIVNDYEEE